LYHSGEKQCGFENPIHAEHFRVLTAISELLPRSGDTDGRATGALRVADLAAHAGVSGDEKRRIEAELKRLVEMIAVGTGSTSVMAAISEREARLREILNQAIEPGPGSL
jgi:hypothetical protein